jgi:hypothetical protein
MARNDPTVSWGEFAAGAPDLAQHGRALLYSSGKGTALLATVRADGPPRLHPITIAIRDERLLAFILPSAKRTDLEVDGRYALHNHQDPAAPSEFSVRGRARRIDDETVRAAATAGWPFEADETYRLFEFLIGSAILGVRPTADDWPPRYTSWSASSPR